MDSYFPNTFNGYHHPPEEQPAQPAIRAPGPFAALYASQMRPVYRYQLARSGDVTAAQTLTGAAFEAALALFLHKALAEDHLLPWLFRVARARLIAHLQRPRPDSALAAAWIDEHGRDGVEVSAQRLRVARLAAALRALPLDRADALALHLFGGLSLEDTAQVLRVKQTAAERMLALALTEIRLLPPAALEMSR